MYYILQCCDYISTTECIQTDMHMCTCVNCKHVLIPYLYIQVTHCTNIFVKNILQGFHPFKYRNALTRKCMCMHIIVLVIVHEADCVQRIWTSKVTILNIKNNIDKYVQFQFRCEFSIILLNGGGEKKEA